MTIREYFYNKEMTIEEYEAKMTEEVELWEALDTVDIEGYDTMLEEWCIAHNVDIEAEENGIKVVTLWAWDMCGD